MNQSAETSSQCANGTIRELGGRKRIYYDGYWIIYYEPPAESLSAKKNMIVNLTRRAFHHTEPGINTPGENLDHARRAYEIAANPAEKRVNASMLAGALFNRATDIFTTVVELEDKGVQISFENELMKECSECLEEAMELGKLVRHRSGAQGIDELWGEPLKAFSMPLEQFYTTRYVKISLTMRDIDRIVDSLRDCLSGYSEFNSMWSLLEEFSCHAKLNSETIKRDSRWYRIWPKFVTNSERIDVLLKQIRESLRVGQDADVAQGCDLVENGKNLMTHISSARVPMTDPTKRFLNQCHEFTSTFTAKNNTAQ